VQQSGTISNIGIHANTRRLGDAPGATGNGETVQYEFRSRERILSRPPPADLDG